MRKHLSRSLLKQISIALFGIYLILVLLMMINDSFAISTIREKISEGLYASLRIYSAQIDTNFSNAETYLVSLAGSTAGYNLRIIERNQDDVEFYRSVTRQKNDLEATLSTFDMIDGLFVFPTSNQLLIASAKTPASPTVKSLRLLMRAMFQSNEIDSLPSKRWFPVYLNKQYYLLRVMKIGTSYVGAWADLSALLSLVTKNQGVVEQAFLSFGDTRVFNKDSQKSDLRPDAVNSTQNYTIYTAGEDYLVLSVPLEHIIDGYVVLFIPDRLFSAQLNKNYLLMSITAAVFIIMALIVIYILRNFLQRPIGQLKVSIDALRKGDFSVRIPNTSAYEEFEGVNLAFNDMVERIRHLKISVYEEQLNQQKFEMKFLKSQIAPHFLINCLNTIYHMTSAGKREEVQKMTIALGEHLRYALSEHTIIPLHVEIENVQNYITLSQMRFPGCIAPHIHIDERAKDAAALPMMLLFFIENIIKYQVLPGEITEIHIEVDLTEKDGDEYLSVKMWDSGEGWSDDVLEKLQSGEMLKNEDGHHIGIRNTYYRMKNYLKDSFKMTFKNHMNAGAEIDLEYPYIPFSVAINTRNEEE